MKQKNLPVGYAKIVANEVLRNHGVYCTPAMVYNVTNRGVNNAYILLEIEKLRNRYKTVKEQTNALKQANDSSDLVATN